MAYTSTNPMFRSLSDDEEAEFREAARAQFDPTRPVNGLWHPVYLDEWTRLTFADVKAQAGDLLD
jgi:hypothetical protein